MVVQVGSFLIERSPPHQARSPFLCSDKREHKMKVRSPLLFFNQMPSRIKGDRPIETRSDRILFQTAC
ncbi:MAG: hypothetical protein HC786_29665 [Richelia sp. CSU_2_1]|nr:hypothetical protein [Microcoleus sp. SU_5_6]NJL66090.1 hypothetical protein [Microcoleus sp. SM1_3_4]NJR25980.1 hypothetical protein [Richelia sp. CSU_2_1]